jgi:hypothetical protein
MFVAVVSPVLQTRAPTGNTFGPTFTLLLSSPTTPHVIGVSVSKGAIALVVGKAAMGTTDIKREAISAKTVIARERSIRLVSFIGVTVRPEYYGSQCWQSYWKALGVDAMGAIGGCRQLEERYSKRRESVKHYLTF